MALQEYGKNRLQIFLVKLNLQIDVCTSMVPVLIKCMELAGRREVRICRSH